MRQVNICNPEEIKRFKSEISDYMWVSETDIIPYRRDDSTEKGANYTIFVPVKWKYQYPPKSLRILLRSEVDADKIEIEYIDFACC
jgi:hypothetical protein